MAKIIVTQTSHIVEASKRIIDTNCKFSQMGNKTMISDPEGKWTFTAAENIEEVYRRIKEAEAEERRADSKFDELLEVLQEIRDLLIGIR